MLHPNRLTASPALVIWLMLAAVLVSSIPTAQARRRRRRRPAKPRVERPTSGAQHLRRVGNPRVVVVRRQGVRDFRLAAAAFRGSITFPTTELALDRAMPPKDLLEDIADAKPKIIVALGPWAARVLARGLADVPVVFGYLPGLPTTSALQGGWLSLAPSSPQVVRWLERLVPRLRRVALVVADAKDALAVDFEKACRHRGIQPVVVVATSAADVPSRVVLALKQRPDALWLGRDVALYPPAVLLQLRRLQALHRIPLVGITREHARQGLVLAVDASPARMAEAARRLVRRKVASWLLPGAARPRRAARGATVPPLRASRLVREVLVPDRVTVNTVAARALGLDPGAALRAGAKRADARQKGAPKPGARRVAP
jgi:hypothetical protein